MNRFDIIQQIIAKKKSRNYLEIGVEKGKVFLKIKVRKKIAVDPAFKIRRKQKIKACLSNATNLFNEYYEMTSDSFFEKHRNRLTRLNGLDIAFVDGLHTYGQTLKDVINCLEHLKPGGVIAVHDCNPATAASAVPAESRERAANMNLGAQTKDWSGDVWKTIVCLRSTRNDLKICVLDCDHGVALITRGRPESMLDYSLEKIDRLDFDDLEKNRRHLLNLKSPNYLHDFLSSMADDSLDGA
jgi:hypothetical protein